VTETRYFHDGARIIEEQDAAKTTLATYTYGNYIDEVLTMNRAGQTFYYHQNSLWSVEAITNAAANVVERYAYDAYGVPKIMNAAGAPVPSNSWGTAHSAIGNPWMFTGRQFDEETGLYYYRARYYDPVMGRFVQRDALGYLDGVNLYQYVRGNPIVRNDPFGFMFIGCDPWGEWGPWSAPVVVTLPLSYYGFAGCTQTISTKTRSRSRTCYLCWISYTDDESEINSAVSVWCPEVGLLE
jgi:RHS repeat-associated protein